MELLATPLTFHNPDIRLGFHIGTYNNLVDTFESVMERAPPLRSYQIYISDGKPWQAPQWKSDDIRMAGALLQRNYKYACVHGSLMYNLAGSTDGRSDPQFQRKVNNTCSGLMGELDVAAGFGGGVVVHVGTCKNKERGIFTIARTIEAVLDRESFTTQTLSRELQIPIRERRKIILENAAGEKNKIGSNLDEIAQIINSVEERLRPQIKVCIDTAHIFGAGQYDFGSPDDVDKFYTDFDEKIGLDRLELFHFNDSRVPYGSHKDRHENLGVGYIFGIERNEDENGDGLEGLKAFVDKAEEYRIPLIGEPPGNSKDKGPPLGPGWDYEVVRHVCSLERTTFVC